MNKRDSKGRFLKENKIWETKKGYLMCWHNGKNKLVHELIWECFNGCSKPKGFDIHHIDENKQNNVIFNLELVSKQTHSRIHAGWIRD